MSGVALRKRTSNRQGCILAARAHPSLGGDHDDGDSSENRGGQPRAHSVCGVGGNGGEPVALTEGNVGPEYRWKRGGSAPVSRGDGGYRAGALGALLAVQGGGGGRGAG